MKKNQLTIVFATLILGVVLMFSCQKEEVSNPEQGLMLKNGSIDCSECVDEWMDSKDTQWGWVKYDNSKNKTVEEVPDTYLETYNDGTNVYYRVYRTNGTFEGVWVNEQAAYEGEAVNTYSWSTPLAEGWEKCDKVTVKVELRGVSGTGKTEPKSFDYFLRELCLGCEESFTYVLNEDKSYTFTYTPAEDMTDQLVVFTFAQGTVVEGLNSWTTNGITRQKTMSFTKCEPVSWTVTLTADCNGHSGQSNVWTDFKVNDATKKGSLANIILVCE